jgi:hypothetical protein
MVWDSSTAHHLMKLSKAISFLPNAKPRKARWLLNDIQDYFFNQMLGNFGNDTCEESDSYDPYQFNQGNTLSYGELQELMITQTNDWGDETLFITPRGAEILIELYQNKIFELTKQRDGVSTPKELLDYSQSSGDLIRKVENEKKLAAQALAQEKYWDENPEELPETLFSATRLNRIMIKHMGLGMHASMMIGGIKVTKHVNSYKSNSGKSHDNDINLEWTGSDGQRHEQPLRASMNKYNRRNDANRNWGLPK